MNSLHHLAELYVRARQDKEHAEELGKELGGKMSVAEKRLVEAMQEQGVNSLKVPDLGSFSTRPKVYAHCGSLEELKAWLLSRGEGAVIKEHVPPGTLNSIVKGELEAGRDVPPGVSAHMEIKITYRSL